MEISSVHKSKTSQRAVVHRARIEPVNKGVFAVVEQHRMLLTPVHVLQTILHSVSMLWDFCCCCIKGTIEKRAWIGLVNQSATVAESEANQRSLPIHSVPIRSASCPDSSWVSPHRKRETTIDSNSRNRNKEEEKEAIRKTSWSQDRSHADPAPVGEKQLTPIARRSKESTENTNSFARPRGAKAYGKQLADPSDDLALYPIIYIHIRMSVSYILCKYGWRGHIDAAPLLLLLCDHCIRGSHLFSCYRQSRRNFTPQFCRQCRAVSVAPRRVAHTVGFVTNCSLATLEIIPCRTYESTWTRIIYIYSHIYVHIFSLRLKSISIDV